MLGFTPVQPNLQTGSIGRARYPAYEMGAELRHTEYAYYYNLRVREEEIFCGFSEDLVFI